jgi:hypothetical protein
VLQCLCYNVGERRLNQGRHVCERRLTARLRANETEARELGTWAHVGLSHTGQDVHGSIGRLDRWVQVMDPSITLGDE